jgi:hypothetical protein
MLELFKEVETSGQPLIVTEAGQPALEIRPYKVPAPEGDPMAALRGSVLYYDNCLDPVGEDDWEALK